MHVIICGGRDYTPTPADLRWLNALHAERGRFGKILTGDASGVDTWAQWWAHHHRIPCQVFRAAWHEHGRAAGPIRNAAMLAALCKDAEQRAIIALPGGKGTADMIRQGQAKGVAVWKRKENRDADRC